MCYCVQTITETKLVKARKDYRDSNREWIMELWNDDARKQCTTEEIALIEKRISEKWIIKKGDVYEFSVLKNDDGIYSWRTLPGLNEICHKYELYPEC